MYTNKIVLVIKTTSAMGGVERRLIRVFSRLREYEVDIIVLIPTEQDLIKKTLRQFTSDNYCGMQFTTSLREVLIKIIKGKYRWVCYANSGGSFLMIPFISKLFKSRRLWVIANYYTSRQIFSNYKEKILFRLNSILASRVDCLYPADVETLKAKMRKIEVTPTPIPFTDIDLFKPLKKENIIVFGARLEEMKGCKLFIDTIKSCQNYLSQYGYRVLICGSGRMDEEIKENIKKDGLSDIIEMKGYCPLNEVLPYAKVFMSIQKIENYPSQSLLEAIASGCWVIATNVGDTDKLVYPEYGELVDYSVEKVSEAIIRAIKMSDLKFNEATISARKFAEEKFHIETSIEYFTNILREM